jgi:hypothetical protein
MLPIAMNADLLELTDVKPPPLPNFAVTRGYVVAFGQRVDPVVKGGGATIAGWGSSHVWTEHVRHTEFWIHNVDTRVDEFINMGKSDIPPMLPGHAVSIVHGLRGREICAIVNYNTGVMCSYRPSNPGPYRSSTGLWGALMLLALAGICCAAYIVAADPWMNRFIPWWWYPAMIAIAILAGKANRRSSSSVRAANEKLDREISTLIDAARLPARI